jgi:small subunit ribosomal protein S5
MIKEKESEKEKKEKSRDAEVDKIEEKIEKVVEKEINGGSSNSDSRGRGGRGGSNRSRRDKTPEDNIANWIPKTELGKLVMAGKIKDIDEIFDKNLKILEPEIVDYLLRQNEFDLINIGQAKGKFGGGKRRPWRQTQKKTCEGNVPTFSCMVVVGDKNGHVGLGYGRAKETVPARMKAIRNAKLNLIRVKRGCGSFDCTCSEEHSIPIKVIGKVGSTSMKLMPAPKGTGLAIENDCKKIMKLAGIKDIYSKTNGQTRTKINLTKACIRALERIKEFV